MSLLGVAVAVTKFRYGLAAGYDTYAFLCNAAHMAGRSVGYLEPSRPPLLSFLTSLVMRFGLDGETALLLVDVTMAAIGIVAVYGFLAQRFTGWLAAAGTLMFVAMPPYWAIVGTGMTDNVSVVLSLLAILALIRATEHNPRWYLVALPLMAAAFLSRYGALLMVVPVGIWMVFRAEPIRHAKHIAAGVAGGIFAYCLAGYWFVTTQGNFMYPFQLAGMVAEGQFAVGGAYSQNQGTTEELLARAVPGQWYLQNLRALVLPSGLGVAGLVAMLGTGAGMLVAAVKALSPRLVRGRWVTVVVAAALAVAAQPSTSMVLRMLTIVGLGISVAWCVRPRAEDGTPLRTDDYRWALDATVLVWGLVFFDAHGHMAAVVDRYFLTMMPPLVYFTLHAWRTVAAQFAEAFEIGSTTGERGDSRGASTELGASVGAVAIAALVATSAAFYTVTAPPLATSARSGELVAGLQQCAQWLVDHDSRVRDKTVLSTAWPHMSWYLGQYVMPMPPFPDQRGIEWELDKRRADYYVVLGAKTYPGYEIAFTGSGKVSVLRRTQPFEDVPRVLYLGRGWDTYLERVTHYDFQLMYGRRRGLATDEWWLDRPTASQMAEYDAVAIYGVEWKDRAKGERELLRYVEDGGVVVIDASRNVDSINNNLTDSALFGTVIRRVQLPENGTITFENGFRRSSGSTATVTVAPFVDEQGGPWYGTVYQPVNSDVEAQTQVLARMNGEPVVAVQRIGKGRVYWIAGNLVWHAYLSENVPDSPQRVPGSPESDVIRGIMRDALGLGPAKTEPRATIGTSAAVETDR